ncbi:hypothetical protein B0H14DRAFT_2889818 [Mycena olivaceomarginata]|nr:hypothetical protein B0H14DRAFT_2889818 [Mycena olivaceomarginata]
MRVRSISGLPLILCVHNAAPPPSLSSSPFTRSELPRSMAAPSSLTVSVVIHLAHLSVPLPSIGVSCGPRA